jgi:acetylornithine deacetylase/succinyl-diaminopimelate desuccinylase family protein
MQLSDAKLAKKLTDLLSDLVAISTIFPPGESSQMAKHIADILDAVGYKVEIISAEIGLDNVVAKMGSGKPSLVFNTHIDTVDAGDLSLWKHPPYSSIIEDGRLYGLGAANCKGTAATQIMLALEIANRGGPAMGEVVFTFVTEEENLGPKGMAHLRDIGAVNPDMLLVAAPTQNTLINTERGVMWATLTTSGRPAHAGQPQKGDNAIMRMVRVLTHLDKELKLYLADRTDGDLHATINIGKINGGINTNVVPSNCIVEIDRRLLPNETVNDAFSELSKIIAKSGEPADQVTISLLRGTNGFSGNGNGDLESALSRGIEKITGSPAKYSVAAGVSDGRHFADDDIEIVIFGPGDDAEGHAVNESIKIDELVDSTRILDDTFSHLTGYKA